MDRHFRTGFEKAASTRLKRHIFKKLKDTYKDLANTRSIKEMAHFDNPVAYRARTDMAIR